MFDKKKFVEKCVEQFRKNMMSLEFDKNSKELVIRMTIQLPQNHSENYEEYTSQSTDYNIITTDDEIGFFNDLDKKYFNE